MQDIHTLIADVKYLDELVTVVKDIANNETNSTTLNYYDEIMYSMDNSIVALINFVSMQYTHTHTTSTVSICSLQILALEKNATADNVTKEEEEEGEGFNTHSQSSTNTTETIPTNGKPTDLPVTDKIVRHKPLT